MDLERKTAKSGDMRTVLFVLWVFVMLNYLYCDVLALMDPQFLKDMLAGTATVKMTPAALMGASILMEIPMAMVLLSKLVAQRWNRIFNIIAGTIMTVVQIGTLFIGVATSYYVFFSIIEIACTVSIVIIALRWKKTYDQSQTVISL